MLAQYKNPDKETKNPYLEIEYMYPRAKSAAQKVPLMCGQKISTISDYIYKSCMHCSSLYLIVDPKINYKWSMKYVYCRAQAKHSNSPNFQMFFFCCIFHISHILLSSFLSER